MRRRSPRLSAPVRVIPYAAVRPRTDGSLALQPATGPPQPVRRSGGGSARPVRRNGALLWSVEPREPAPDGELGTVLTGVLLLITEVLAGSRPVRQLARRATPAVCEGLQAHVRPGADGAPIRPPRVLASWAQEPATGVAETGAVIAVAGRVQAIALRLELQRGRWRCTALETTTPR